VDPVLTILDGADWAPGRSRRRDRKEVILADFALQRQASLNILQSLGPEEWERRGRTAAGDVSVREFVRAWADHDREHIAQLEALIGESVEDARLRRARSAREGPLA
jgi:hypothetical protein